MKTIFQFFLIVVLLVGVADAFAQCKSETQAKVESAIKSVRVETLSKQLREIGSTAVPCVLNYMSRRGYKNPVMTIVLLDNFVSQSEGTEVEAALIELLKDKQPELRGYAVYELGKRKVNRAIPFLVERLDDKENTVVICTLNNPCDEILVRDYAVKALESTTNTKLTSSKNKAKQAKAWRRWWEKQQKQKT